jgi:hypothetical protein
MSGGRRDWAADLHGFLNRALEYRGWATPRGPEQVHGFPACRPELRLRLGRGGEAKDRVSDASPLGRRICDGAHDLLVVAVPNDISEPAQSRANARDGLLDACAHIGHTTTLQRCPGRGGARLISRFLTMSCPKSNN